MGGYRKTTSTSTRNKIVATSKEMVEEAISYTLFSLITHNASSSDIEIGISNLQNVRCDGFVEYAYESNGQIIRGGNISTYYGAESDNAMSRTVYFPKHQAESMTKL